LYEEFLRSTIYSRAIYAVNAELHDGITEKVAGRLKHAKKFHPRADLRIILQEADIELNDIMNNATGPKAAEKYWESRSFKHILKKHLKFLYFKDAMHHVNIRRSRDQIYPKIAEDNGYKISGKKGFELLGIPR